MLTLVGSPEAVHAVPHQDDAGQLREGLGDVEVAQRADLEEGHAQLLGVHLRLLGGHLPLVGQVEAVAHQDLGHPRCMLGNKQNKTKKKREIVSSGYLWVSVTGINFHPIVSCIMLLS